ncbi:hypothetical protein BDQ17DRAFT_667536 [Cyathus striatus]|nr:hypothetical protein BDQ17DRAFT_667536 [Cyathus striatus]
MDDLTHNSDKLCIQAILSINHGRTYGNKDHDCSIYLYWMGVMLESVERGKMYFLGDERSQYIFCRLWGELRDLNSYFYHSIDIFYKKFADNYALFPTIFNYLLERIKPSSTFVIYLREFEPAFQEWFYDEWDYNPDEDDLVKCSMNSLKANINAHLNECVTLEESHTKSNEDHSNTNLSYKMALNYICN